MARRNITCIAFDIGDTLIETKSAMLSAAKYAARKMQFENFISDKDKMVSTFFDIDEKTYFPHINHFFSHVEIVRDTLILSDVMHSTRSLSVTDVSYIFISYYRYRLRQLIRKNQKIISLLSNLHQKNFKLGIISNGTVEGQIEVLTRLGVVSFFDDILISQAVGFEKPAPQIFHIAAERLKSSAENIFFIGDDLENDIRASLAAGFNAALFTQYQPALSKYLTRGITQIEHLEDVLALVETNNRS